MTKDLCFKAEKAPLPSLRQIVLGTLIFRDRDSRTRSLNLF